jgi:hypothetical protein
MGEYIEQFPSLEECRFHGREGTFIFFPVYPEKRKKNINKG